MNDEQERIHALEERVNALERENELLIRENEELRLKASYVGWLTLPGLSHNNSLDPQPMEQQRMVNELLSILHESETRFRQLADSMPQLVWTADSNGIVDYYNIRHKEYSGIALSANQGWEWSPVVHPDDLQATADAWTNAVATGDMYQVEHRVRTSGGEYEWHLSRGVPVRGNDGSVVKWYGTATNIHDLKIAEESLQDYAFRLERSNQELQDFAFVASHDLQEPLRKIRSFGSMLQRKQEADLDDESRDLLDRMINAADRMQTMITGLLELSQVNAREPAFTRLDLNRLLFEVLSDLEGRVISTGGNVTIDPLPVIDADPLQFRQLFQNLIGNALKFHKPGEKPAVTIRALQGRKSPGGPGTISIQVEDQGIGFNDEEAQDIFQPFHRLHGRSQYEGTGIGLAICHRIVERHHGELLAHGEEGKGSVFTIILPEHQA